MNPTAQPEAQSPGEWSRMAWLPIPLLLAAIIAARLAGLRESYQSHALLLALSVVFYTLFSLGTLYLIGRSFLALGSPGLLLLECGVVLWSLAGTVGDFVSHGDANINVTIFNIGILLAGLCHLAGAILALSPQRVLRVKSVWLAAGCAFTLGALWFISRAALSGWLPVFFIPGQGGTLVRYAVLISAIAMFVLSAGVLHANQRVARLPFTSWYALALLLLAVGLFGIMIQLSLGSVVNWLSRAAQWLGGLYLLFAALASLRESHLPLLPLEKKSHPAYYRYAVAVAVVFASAAIRLAFLSAMGKEAPYLVFFPAVMFAAIYGGFGPGLLATAISAILTDYFWIEPVNQFSKGRLSSQVSIVIFLLSGGMVSWVTDSMRRARARASAAEAQALLASEREKAAEALHEGRAKLEAALASMTDAVIISDAQGRFIDFNDAFATYYRFRNKGECFKAIAEYPDVLDVFMADGTPAPLDMWAVPRALRGETATNAEYTLRRKDTGEIWDGSYGFAPIRDKDGAIVGSVVVIRDITERKRAEEKIRQQNRILEAINQIFEKALSCNTQEELGRKCLMVAEELTGSKFGFIGEIGEDGLLHDIAISDPGWKLCTMYDKTGHRRPAGDFKIHGLYGRVLQDSKSLLVNHPSSHPDSIGVPEGHPVLESFLGVPLLRENRTIGMVAMGNREGGYRLQDMEALEALAPAIVETLARKQAEEALNQRTLELQRLTETLEQEVQTRTEELEVANKELKVEVDQCQRVEIELKKSESELRQLSLELLSAQEKERKLVAGEIHDSIGSSLSAIKFKVETALTEVAGKSPVTTSLQSLIPIVQGAIDEARRI